MIYERGYNYSKVRKICTKTHRRSKYKKQEKYIEMKDILSDIY